MAGLHGKLVAAIEFKAGADVYHEIFSNKPHHVSTASPELVQGCDLHEGEYGKVGSIICWRYTHDGKERIAKQLVQILDEENKKVQYKVLEGDLLEKYKEFIVSMHIETKNGIDLVTWTLDYVTLNEDVEHPITLLTLLIDMTKDIENHHLAN